MKIFVCTNTRPLSGQPSCGGRGSEALIVQLEAGIRNRNMNCEVKPSVCMGYCEKGPNIKVAGQTFCHGVDSNGIVALLDELERGS
tara:strand:- start:9159 stop:9416 length:258 start_codon:yes stop_codon:yes gene_type:complete